MNKAYQPGSLIKMRNREWVVLPSPDPELLMVKPLGGSDEETTAVFLPLNFKEEKPEPAEFPYPSVKDIGNFSTAYLLYNSARLSFRSAAGPFRCIGKLSFRPRSYQLVPLSMALKQTLVRLFIADDVGVGKTVEALLIARELLDRGEIERFAVICLPHLCEQWQQELREKFSIDAVIIRSSTAAQLDRKIQGDASIFRQYPFQIISIDFIKSGPKREIFLNEAPEFVIIDEAHSCAKPSGATVKQMQRYHLVHDLAAKSNQHIVLLTATPHSGKQQEFQSLLGLLKKDFESVDLVASPDTIRKQVADHLIIRRRADVEQWYEETPFPKRESGEVEYILDVEYQDILKDLLAFARKIDLSDLTLSARKKFRYFAILSLLRGVMSSPKAGIEMLTRKAAGTADEDNDDITNPVADTEGTESDELPVDYLHKADLTKTESHFFTSLAGRLASVRDNKAEQALKILLSLLKEGFNPVIFCRFIDTALYLEEYIKDKLPKNTGLLTVTGLMVDEQRREKIAEFEHTTGKRVLISTDCLSEGINLQRYFTAVIHYDLPWNPNRLEQREGRVDRFGQPAPLVKTYMLWGKDNPIDNVVLGVLLRKAKEIKKQTGISVPFPDDSQSIMDSLLTSVILNPAAYTDEQMQFGFTEKTIQEKEIEVKNAYEQAAERDKITRSIFAQHSVKAGEIEKDLKEIDEAVGNTETVRQFVIDCVTHLGGQMQKYKEGFRLFTTNLNISFKSHFNHKPEVLVCFDSPVPDGYIYIGRNSAFVEQLCHYIMNNSLSSEGSAPAARASVILSDKADIKKTIIQLRVRNIISDKKNNRELVAEEMILWGYSGSLADKAVISQDECKILLESTIPSGDLSMNRRVNIFQREIDTILSEPGLLSDIVRSRSQKLIEAHDRFRKLVGGNRYQVVEPVVPPDILGVYIIIPQIGGSN